MPLQEAAAVQPASTTSSKGKSNGGAVAAVVVGGGLAAAIAYELTRPKTVTSPANCPGPQVLIQAKGNATLGGQPISDSFVYVTGQNGILYPVQNAAAAAACGYDLTKLTPVEASVIATCYKSFGPMIQGAGTCQPVAGQAATCAPSTPGPQQLVQVNGDLPSAMGGKGLTNGQVCVTGAGGVLYWINSMDTFHACGYDASKVIQVPAAALAACYKTWGPTIMDASSCQPAPKVAPAPWTPYPAWWASATPEEKITAAVWWMCLGNWNADMTNPNQGGYVSAYTGAGAWENGAGQILPNNAVQNHPGNVVVPGPVSGIPGVMFEIAFAGGPTVNVPPPPGGVIDRMGGLNAQVFVTNCYALLLGRAGSAAEIGSWITGTWIPWQNAHPGAPYACAQAVLMGFSQAPEFQNRAHAIAGV